MTRAAISSSSAMVFDLVLLLGSNNERSGWRCCGWQSERGRVGSGRLVFVRGFSAGADPEFSTLELVLSHWAQDFFKRERLSHTRLTNFWNRIGFRKV